MYIYIQTMSTQSFKGDKREWRYTAAGVGGGWGGGGGHYKEALCVYLFTLIGRVANSLIQDA